MSSDPHTMCKESRGLFCGMIPDWDKTALVSGRDIVHESLRQRCLWELTKSRNLDDEDSPVLSSEMDRGLYSQQWWKYVAGLQKE